MSKEAARQFERRAKAYGIDVSRGLYGELLDSEARKAWYFWIMSWQARAKAIRKRASSRRGNAL